MSLLIASLALVGALLAAADGPGRRARLRRLLAALERSGQDAFLLPDSEQPTSSPGDRPAAQHRFA